MFRNKAVFIIGPTCVGKTDLSIKLLDCLPFEIISIDSSMVYKHMNIGTGKPCKAILNQVKHNLIDICNPSEFYSVFNFCFDSFFLMQACWINGKIPLFVGGSMMYFNVFNSLMKDLPYNFLNIALLPICTYDLYRNIRHRFYTMIKCGFIDEVYYLFKNKYLDINYKSINSIGYKELFLYICGKLSFYDAEKKILSSTYSLSNGQMFWIKHCKNNFVFIDKLTDKSFFWLLNLLYKFIF